MSKFRTDAAYVAGKETEYKRIVELFYELEQASVLNVRSSTVEVSASQWESFVQQMTRNARRPLVGPLRNKP